MSSTIVFKDLGVSQCYAGTRAPLIDPMANKGDFQADGAFLLHPNTNLPALHHQPAWGGEVCGGRILLLSPRERMEQRLPRFGRLRMMLSALGATTASNIRALFFCCVTPGTNHFVNGFERFSREYFKMSSVNLAVPWGDT